MKQAVKVCRALAKRTNPSLDIRDVITWTEVSGARCNGISWLTVARNQRDGYDRLTRLFETVWKRMRFIAIVVGIHDTK